MQRILGTVQQAITAFEFKTCEQTWLADRLAILTQASTTEPYRCTDEVQRTLTELADRIKNQKRKLINPDELLTEETCIVIMSDASDEGIGASLGICRKSNAADVTPEDLHNPEMYQLVSTLQLVLSSDEKRQLTFEREVLGMYKAVDKWRNILAKAGGRFLTADAGGHPKIVLMMDSTTATSKWMSMGIPITLEHTSAKGHKYACMADEMAFLRSLPVESKWLPGERMSFPDVLSRIELMMKEATAIRKTVQKAGAAALQFHTYDQEKTKEAPGRLPEGARITHLKLGKEQTARLRAAQLQDNEKFHNVPMGTIAAVAMNRDGGDPALRGKAAKYIGKLFFAVTPPGEDAPLLFTPASSLRRHEEARQIDGDQTRNMVLVIPKGVKAQVTNTEQIFDIEPATTGEAEDDIPQWIEDELDLRKDLIRMCHDLAHHPTEAASMTALKSMAAWATMKTDLRDHIDSCPDCLEERKASAAIGVGIVSAQRGDVMQFDHYVLSKEEAELTGIPGVLTMCDVASRRVEYEAAEDLTAMETARIIYTRWIRYISTPRMMISDGAAAYTGQVMKCLLQLMGIKEHDISAPRAKGKVSIVEAKNKPLSEVLADGFSKGDITSRADLDMYLAAAVIRVNQCGTANRITPYHIWHGQPPVLTRTLATERGAVKIPKELTVQESKLLNTIKRHTSELLEMDLQVRDEEARNNYAKRAATQPQTGYTKFKINIGQEISYDGKSAKLTSTTGASEDQPVTAVITMADGKTKKVKYTEIRPAATPRPVHRLPKSVNTGSMVFYDDKEGVRAGKAVEVNNDKITLQQFIPNETNRVWLPDWRLEDNETKQTGEQPKGARPELVKIRPTKVIATGQLKKSGHLTAPLIKTLTALRVI
jgi:hypothetical protein